MLLQSSIDELAALIAELQSLQGRLQTADPQAPDRLVLWEAETKLRHLGQRATRRADVLRRVVEVVERRQSA